MAKDKCISSIRQRTVWIAQVFKQGKGEASDTPEVAATGFVDFEQGKEYDLDKIKFHHDAEQDKSIREGLRASDKFEQVKGSTSSPAGNNKAKGVTDNVSG